MYHAHFDSNYYYQKYTTKYVVIVFVLAGGLTQLAAKH